MSRIEIITITKRRNKIGKYTRKILEKEFRAINNLFIFRYIFNPKYRKDQFERWREKVYVRFVGFNRGILMKRLCLGSILSVALFVALLSANSSAVQESHAKQILVLASYNPGMKWEDSIDSAIRLHFAINDPSAVISIEYMDTKRIDPNQTRLDALKSSIHQKV